jgi:hypothetical protein
MEDIQILMGVILAYVLVASVALIVRKEILALKMVVTHFRFSQSFSPKKAFFRQQIPVKLSQQALAMMIMSPIFTTKDLGIGFKLQKGNKSSYFSKKPGLLLE